MKFSILIPVYNVEKYLAECLNSIDNQTYKDFEVIIVDDGSTDKSAQIVDEYKNLHSNVKVIHKKNGGLISARRVAIKHATGNYYLFCDSDDTYEPNALQDLNDMLIKYDPDLIIFNAYKYYDGKIKEAFFADLFDENQIIDKMDIYDKLLLTYQVNSMAIKCINSKIVDRNTDYSEFYDCNYGEDLLQTVPLIKKAQKIMYLNEFLYNYRIVSGMMRKYNPNYYWSYRKVNVKIAQELENENIMDFPVKRSIHLLRAAYGAVTQFKYLKKIDKKSLNKIANDNIFQLSYKAVFKSKYRKYLSQKEKIVLILLKHKLYFILNLLMRFK